MIADACVGAFFAHDKPKAREQERKARLDLVNRLLAGDERAHEPLAAMARDIRAQHAPFHWMLEFPEVFWEERPDPLDPGAEHRAAYMEAFVGNPPFAGKNAISDADGPGYLDCFMARYPELNGRRTPTCPRTSSSAPPSCSVHTARRTHRHEHHRPGRLRG